MNNTNLILSDESEKMKNRELFEEYFSCSLEIDLLLRLYPDDEDHQLGYAPPAFSGSASAVPALQHSGRVR